MNTPMLINIVEKHIVIVFNTHRNSHNMTFRNSPNHHNTPWIHPCLLPFFLFRLAETPWGSWPASMAMKNARRPGGATGCVFGGWDAGFRTCFGRQESLKNGKSLKFFWNGGVPPNHLFIDRIFPDHPFKWYVPSKKTSSYGGTSRPWTWMSQRTPRLSLVNVDSRALKAGWWFGTCFIFPFSWECHHPNWRSHIFQRGRSTTNQKR